MSGVRLLSGSGGRGNPADGLCLYVRARETMFLRIAGEDDPLIELPLSPDREACCAVERLHDLATRSIRLRTRALTTTMFCRYLLGDLFIHGIGGAKYDELGDSIARRFFGIEPPEFLTLSMTAWLGLPDQTATSSELAIVAVERSATWFTIRTATSPNHFRPRFVT